MLPQPQPRFNGKLKFLLGSFLVATLIIAAQYLNVGEILQNAICHSN